MDENKIIIERMRDDISDLKSTTQVILTKIDNLAGVLKVHADREDDDRNRLIEVLTAKADKGEIARLEAEKNRVLAESSDIHDRIHDRIDKIEGNIWKILVSAVFSAMAALCTVIYDFFIHFIAK